MHKMSFEVSKGEKPADRSKSRKPAIWPIILLGAVIVAFTLALAPMAMAWLGQ
jgi:hypothetical protein